WPRTPRSMRPTAPRPDPRRPTEGSAQPPPWGCRGCRGSGGRARARSGSCLSALSFAAPRAGVVGELLLGRKILPTSALGCREIHCVLDAPAESLRSGSQRQLGIDL